MAEPEDTDADASGDPDESFESEYATERHTAPQSPYTKRDVLVGTVIAAVGILITFGVPLLMA